MRDKIILVVVILVGIIMWRGLKATTETKFNCEYKLVYAVCKAKSGNPPLPTMQEIFKEGIKF